MGVDNVVKAQDQTIKHARRFAKATVERNMTTERDTRSTREHVFEYKFDRGGKPPYITGYAATRRHGRARRRGIRLFQDRFPIHA